jgi:hypothetical protein
MKGMGNSECGIGRKEKKRREKELMAAWEGEDGRIRSIYFMERGVLYEGRTEKK